MAPVQYPTPPPGYSMPHYYSSPFPDYSYSSPPASPYFYPGANYYSPRYAQPTPTPRASPKAHTRRSNTTPQGTYAKGPEYVPIYDVPKRSYATPQGTYARGPEYVPIYDTPKDSHRRRASASIPPQRVARQRPTTSKPTSKATEEDARRAGIPAGYSYKNWDPSEEPIMLLGSVFDANSLGKWIYDWTVYNGSNTRGAMADLKQQSIRQLEVPGKLKGRSVNATPDFGSSFNIIAEKFALENGWKIDRSERDILSLPNGAVRKFEGTVSLPWSFGNESKKHTCIFHVLKGCTHSVVLGRRFLDITDTLGKKSYRVKKTIRSNASNARQRILLVENPTGKEAIRNHIQGSLNGLSISGLADTGSDLTVIKRSAAERLGLCIQEGSDYTTEVEFVDGSTAFTTGMVVDVEWRFGEGSVGSDPQRLNVHVMDDLPCDLILDKWLLWDNQAFRQHEDLFVDWTPNEEHAQYHVCGIKEKRKYKTLNAIQSAIWDLFGASQDGSQGQINSTPVADLRSEAEIIQDEARARTKFLDSISFRDSGEREAAQRDEDARICKWIAAHPTLAARLPMAPPTPNVATLPPGAMSVNAAVATTA